MASIHIEEETETGRGWRYSVRADARPGFEVRLGWSDYDLWGRGSVPPARVVEALVRVLIDRDALDSLGATFDASTARRLVRSLDEDVPRALSDS